MLLSYRSSEGKREVDCFEATLDLMAKPLDQGRKDGCYIHCFETRPGFVEEDLCLGQRDFQLGFVDNFVYQYNKSSFRMSLMVDNACENACFGDDSTLTFYPYSVTLSTAHLPASNVF